MLYLNNLFVQLFISKTLNFYDFPHRALINYRPCVKGRAIARARPHAPQVAEASDSSRAQIYDFLHNGAKLYGKLKLTELIANM